MDNNVIPMEVIYKLPDGSTISRKDVDQVNSYLTIKMMVLMGFEEYSGKPMNLITRNQHGLVLNNIHHFKTIYHKDIIEYMLQLGFTISSDLGTYIVYGYKDIGKIAEWVKMKEYMRLHATFIDP